MPWSKLHDRRLAGCKFRRQHPIGPFFADFACIECRLVVEVLAETYSVLQVIHDRLLAGRPHPSPLPQAGEGGNPP